MYTGAYPPSPRSSDLSQASLSFDLIVDPHELSYWGISPSTEFACIVIWVILWLWVIRLAIFLSVQFESGPHLYRSVIIVSVLVGAAPISIDHLLIMSVQFLGPHLYDRPSSCHVSSVSRTAPIRSVIFLSCQFSFWDRAYTIGHLFIVSVCVEDRTYTIGHYRVSLSRGRTYTIDHLFVMSVQFLGPHLYDRSLLCQFESGPHLYDRASLRHVSSVSGTAPIRSVIIVSV